MNTDRGWSASPVVVLRHRVVAWLDAYHRDNPGRIPTNAHVAEGLDVPVREVMRTTAYLHGQGLAAPSDHLVPEAGNAWLSAQGKDLAAEWQAKRESLVGRRRAIRDALLSWLYEQPAGIDTSEGLLTDVRGSFYGDPFTEHELVEAEEFLSRSGLIEGRPSSMPLLLRPRLTPDGTSCVERFDSDVAAWLDKDRGQVGATSYVFTNTQGVNVANNSPGAQQTATVTIDARRQALQVADALEQTLPILGLGDDDHEAAQATIREIREATEDSNDAGRITRGLNTARRLALAGSAQAAGAGIVVLVEQALQGLGVG